MKIKVEVLDGRNITSIRELEVIANPCKKCGNQPEKILICYGSKPYLVYCKCNSMPTEGIGGLIKNAIKQWNKENPIKGKNK